MIRLKIVIDLRAKFEELTYIKLEEEEEEKRKKKKTAHITNNLVLKLKLKLKVQLTRNREFQFLDIAPHLTNFQHPAILQNKDTKRVNKTKTVKCFTHYTDSYFKFKSTLQIFVFFIIVPRSPLYKIKHNCHF